MLLVFCCCFWFDAIESEFIRMSTVHTVSHCIAYHHWKCPPLPFRNKTEKHTKQMIFKIRDTSANSLSIYKYLHFVLFAFCLAMILHWTCGNNRTVVKHFDNAVLRPTGLCWLCQIENVPNLPLVGIRCVCFSTSTLRNDIIFTFHQFIQQLKYTIIIATAVATKFTPNL